MQLSVHEHFRLQKRPQLSIWPSTATARFDEPWSKVQDHQHSFDAHSHDGAGRVTGFFLPTKYGNTSIMCNHYRIGFLLPDIQDQELLTLRWRSFSRWDKDRLAYFFVYKGCQCCCYVSPLQNYFLITTLTRPKIIDVLLTVIFKMGQGACCLFFCL